MSLESESEKLLTIARARELLEELQGRAKGINSALNKWRKDKISADAAVREELRVFMIRTIKARLHYAQLFLMLSHSKYVRRQRRRYES